MYYREGLVSYDISDNEDDPVHVASWITPIVYWQSVSIRKYPKVYKNIQERWVCNSTLHMVILIIVTCRLF